MRRFGALLILLTFGVASFVTPVLTAHAAQHVHLNPASKSVASRVNVFLKRLAKQRLFMGAILMARRGTTLMDKGYGLADWERHIPNTRQTKFRLASATKQFTAMTILQIQEQGKLSVQDHVCPYLADCPSAWKNVTIRQLLNHTSGVPDPFRDSIVGFYPWKYWTPDQMIGFVKDMPLLFTPGTDWHYSNINYIALGLIVEKASGEPYATFLHDHIFLPLGMTSTGLVQEGESIPNLASGYDGFSRVDVSVLDPTWLFAAGDLYSTVDDLYLWDQALATETRVQAVVRCHVHPVLHLPRQIGIRIWLVHRDHCQAPGYLARWRYAGRLHARPYLPRRWRDTRNPDQQRPDIAGCDLAVHYQTHLSEEVGIAVRRSMCRIAVAML